MKWTLTVVSKNKSNSSKYTFDVKHDEHGATTVAPAVFVNAISSAVEKFRKDFPNEYLYTRAPDFAIVDCHPDCTHVVIGITLPVRSDNLTAFFSRAATSNGEFDPKTPYEFTIYIVPRETYDLEQGLAINPNFVSDSMHFHRPKFVVIPASKPHNWLGPVEPALSELTPDLRDYCLKAYEKEYKRTKKFLDTRVFGNRVLSDENIKTAKNDIDKRIQADNAHLREIINTLEKCDREYRYALKSKDGFDFTWNVVDDNGNTVARRLIRARYIDEPERRATWELMEAPRWLDEFIIDHMNQLIDILEDEGKRPKGLKKSRKTKV